MQQICKTNKAIVFLTILMLAGACSSDIRDPHNFSSGDVTEGTTTRPVPYQTPTPVPTGTGLPGAGGDGVGGNCFEIPELGRTCDADGSIFGNDQGVITVELLNFNNGESVKGGGTYSIRYRTSITYEKFKTVYSKIEYKRQSESTWKLIADKVTANHNEIVEYHWKVCPHLEVEECQRNSSGELVPVNGSDFQLRITSFRLANQSGTITSTGSFTIDSASPTLAAKQASPKLGFTIKSTPTNGFINLEIYGSSDNLSNVKQICLKTTITQPLETNNCWISIAAFNAAITVAPDSVMTIQTLPIFLGYTAKTNLTYYLWLKDAAGNISSLVETVDGENTTYGILEKDKLVLNQSAVTYGTLTSYWQAGSTRPLTPDYTAGLNLSTDASSSSSVIKYLNADNGSKMGDPGTLVVTSAGVVYIKNSGSGAPKGVYKFDLNNGTSSILLGQGNHTLGLADGTTAKVNDPLRIALDSNEDLWVMDKKENGIVVISKVTGLSGASPTLVDMIGGGTNTNSEEMAATSLQIDYSDNLRWYGTFAALPDGILVFSSEDPIKVLKPSSGTGFRLRAYRPERAASAQIQLLTLSTIDSDNAEITTNSGNFLKDIEAYGVFAVSYDVAKRDLVRIYGRGCSPTGSGVSKTCSELVNMVFDRSGNFVSMIATQGPWMWGNEILSFSPRGDLVSMNAYRGRLSLLEGASLSGNWIDALTDEGVGVAYCENGSVAGQCATRIKDFYITISGRIFFLDEQRLRFIDDDGTIQSILSFQ